MKRNGGNFGDSMMYISSIGELTQNNDIDEWFVSKPIGVPFFSGKLMQFIIDDEIPESKFPQDVEDSIANFLALKEDDRIDISDRVYKNYRDYIEAVDMEELPVSNSIEIWNFVTPTEIYVSRRRRNNDIYVQVACECGWEEEHGLQLVFHRGNKLVRVSDQDGHLTHADAYGLPESKDKGI